MVRQDPRARCRRLTALAEFERALAAMYRVCGERWPEERMLFARLEQAEIGHAECVARIERSADGPPGALQPDRPRRPRRRAARSITSSRAPSSSTAARWRSAPLCWRCASSSAPSGAPLLRDRDDRRSRVPQAGRQAAGRHATSRRGHRRAAACRQARTGGRRHGGGRDGATDGRAAATAQPFRRRLLWASRPHADGGSADPVRQVPARVAREPVATLAFDRFVELGLALDLDEALVRSRIRFGDDHYARNLVCRTPDFELLVRVGNRPGVDHPRPRRFAQRHPHLRGYAHVALLRARRRRRRRERGRRGRRRAAPGPVRLHPRSSSPAATRA